MALLDILPDRRVEGGGEVGMIQIDVPMPKCCDECFALDDHGDYPFCLISQDQRGYTFNSRENRMPTCPLKAQEPREPHYTKLEYIINGMPPIVINHPECPRCYDNGLALWDAEIERGAAYCKRCGQAVKWND